MPSISVGRAVLHVDDEDAALAFYVGGLGFRTLTDETRDSGLRLVHVGSDGIAGPGLWLLRGPDRRSGPAAVLYTDDLDESLSAVVAHGGSIARPAAHDGGARFAHIVDPAGNELVLVQLEVEARS